MELTRCSGHMDPNEEEVFLWRRLDARMRGIFERRWWRWFGPVGGPTELSKEFEPTAQTIINWARAGGSRRGSSRRRLDERRAVGAASDQAGESSAARRARHFGKGRGLVRAGERLDTGKVFEFVSANRADHKVATMCRVLGVSASGYYAWLRRGPSPRARRDAELAARIEAIHRDSRGTYGAPRIHAELREEGERLGRKRVARLMRESGLRGVDRRKWVKTTAADAAAEPAPDLVRRDFSASAANELWVADATYVPTLAGFLFLAVVVDVYSRRVVGWCMGAELVTRLMLDALNMALEQRGARGVIHHSDRGSQYTSIAFGNRCRDAGVRLSMGSTGDCYDNALCESFFATLECELIDRATFRTRREAELAIFDFIEGFYNSKRRHSSIGYLSPAEFERRGGCDHMREAA